MQRSLLVLVGVLALHTGGWAADPCDAGVCLSGDALPLDWSLGLQGLIKPSDHQFDDFISPMTNPVFFEDPRTLTEARFIFANHAVPDAVLGGDIQVYALQLRAALTDRLSFIATKDGYIVSDNPLIGDGWADVAAGLKYNLFVDHEAQQILSVGSTFEFPVGTSQSQQGNGDGELHIFASGGMELLDQWHFLSGSGFRIPMDGAAESSVWYWSNHLDYQLGDTGFYLLGETNWYHWMSSGSAFALAPVEGLDFFNLGAVGVAGNDIVTGALGVKYKPTGNLELGLANEIPLTERQDVLENRLTFDAIVRF